MCSFYCNDYYKSPKPSGKWKQQLNKGTNDNSSETDSFLVLFRKKKRSVRS